MSTIDPNYWASENMEITGTLSDDQGPVVDGFVGIQFIKPDGQTMLFRTMNTGSLPIENPLLLLREQLFTISDAMGNPKTDRKAYAGTVAYFFVRLTNADTVEHDYFVTVTVFDSDNTPLSWASGSGTVPMQSSHDFNFPVDVPYWATNGDSKAYACVFRDEPKLGGSPWYKEIDTTFIIMGGRQPKGATFGKSNPGEYELIFKIPFNVVSDYYSIHATSTYNGESRHQTILVPIEKRGDFDGDGDIDFWDIIDFVNAYNDYDVSGGTKYDPKADFVGQSGPPPDGAIDFWDIIAFVEAYNESN